MSTAQTAFAVLLGMILSLSTVLFLWADEDARMAGALVIAWVFAILGLIGIILLASMIFYDRRT